jgi:ATP-binding cassette subfamily F protein 3
MPKLDLQCISKSYAGLDLLRDFSLQLDQGVRLALVGPNGCGKSTLLRIIAGEVLADKGSVHIPSGTRIGYAEQEFAKETVQKPLLSWVLEKLPSWLEFWDRWEKATQDNDEQALKQLSREQTQLEQLYGYNPEHRAKAILFGLGFTEEQFSEPLKNLSGGWRERAKLARILVEGADVLLLDEPTNHLDLEAVQWLESFLLDFSGVLVFVAHDRYFLDKVSNHILFLGSEKPVFRSGNFSDFLQWQAEKDALQQKRAAKLEKDIQHKQKFVDRFRYKATKARQAQSRIKQIDRLKSELEKNSKEKERKSLSFSWPEPPRGNYNVLSAVQLSYAFPGCNELWKPLSFNLYRGQKVALVGPNGCGKSTLLKLLMGSLVPQSGHIKIGSAISVGYFSQHQTEFLKDKNTLLAEIRRLSSPRITEEELRSVLGLFLLGENYWEQPVESLSGGEKNRLVLASLFLARANFLVLDEPTNHLDLESREALVQALQNYSGTILIVAHDRYLLSQVARELWILSPEGLEELPQGYAQYEQMLNKDKEKSAPAAKDRDSEGSGFSAKERRRMQAEKRNQIYRELKPKKTTYQSLEKDLEANLEEQSRLEKSLSDPETYSNNPEEIQRLNKNYQELQRQGEELLLRLSELEAEIQDLENKREEMLCS